MAMMISCHDIIWYFISLLSLLGGCTADGDSLIINLPLLFDDDPAEEDKFSCVCRLKFGNSLGETNRLCTLSLFHDVSSIKGNSFPISLFSIDEKHSTINIHGIAKRSCCEEESVLLFLKDCSDGGRGDDDFEDGRLPVAHYG